MKTFKVGIVNYAEMKSRTLAIARGDLKPIAGEPKVWFTSPEGVAIALSTPNHSLLAAIARPRPDALRAEADNDPR